MSRILWLVVLAVSVLALGACSMRANEPSSTVTSAPALSTSTPGDAVLAVTLASYAAFSTSLSGRADNGPQNTGNSPYVAGSNSTFTPVFTTYLPIIRSSTVVTTYVPIIATSASGLQANQGLQGGWAINDNGGLTFPHALQNQLPLIASAGAGWVRINFRLGSCYSNWTAAGCNGSTALEQYDILVNDARSRGLRVLGLLSNESWPLPQPEWTANNAEIAGGNGDNPYLAAFSQQAAVVLSRHFQGRIDTWEVWNEPNAWTSNPSPGIYVGGTFMYPSNFAWLLTHVYEDTRLAGVSGVQFISGAVFGHDPGGLNRTIQGVDVLMRGDYRAARRSDAGPLSEAPTSTVPSGAEYLTNTYQQGQLNAGWNRVRARWGSYPLDTIGQHLYIDQGEETSSTKIRAYLDDVRKAYVAFEGSATARKTVITEVGWSTAFVSEAVQASNLQTAYSTFETTSYLTNAYWFAIQDVPEANLYYGLQTGGGTGDGYQGEPKPSFRMHQTYAAY